MWQRGGGGWEAGRGIDRLEKGSKWDRNNKSMRSRHDLSESVLHRDDVLRFGSRVSNPDHLVPCRPNMSDRASDTTTTTEFSRGKPQGPVNIQGLFVRLIRYH